MDTIGDFLTIIRNAVRAQKESCAASFSKMREGILRILKNTGFIEDFSVGVCPCKGFRHLTVVLRYDEEGRSPIKCIERCSTPGRRLYYGSTEIPRVLNGLGVGVLSTSKGIMRDSEARRKNIGGELICKIW
ncbi:MAG: 30S ribosomal protein S8 [Puniceicoccales bacterium]|jgi:small subunit ribosomal protein S8|nr:30S ribosomal protein S8 [Puniceicoccales bacterium]